MKFVLFETSDVIETTENLIGNRRNVGFKKRDKDRTIRAYVNPRSWSTEAQPEWM